ncbi:MAG: MOSC domain-containing protein [Acidobacteriota bacterium]|nr:MOSC domain-containing protein [Acidobacteriota bacterium]
MEPLSGEAPDIASLRGSGLVGDRTHDVCDAGTGAALTFRDAPLLLFYAARLADELLREDVDAWTRVRTPEGTESPLDARGWLEEAGTLLGRRICLRGREPAEGPLRLISRSTLRLAERTYGAPLEPVRVRANLVVEITDGKAFDEDLWIGHRIGIGETLLEVTGWSTDAFVASYRPEVRSGDPGMLEELVRLREGRFGVAARVLSGLRIRAGDPVALSD